MWKRVRVKGKPKLDERLEAVAAQAQGLNTRLKDDAPAVLRELRRLMAKVYKVEQHLKDERDAAPEGDLGMLEGTGRRALPRRSPGGRVRIPTPALRPKAEMSCVEIHRHNSFVASGLIPLQRVEHQPAEQLRIEIRRFRRHLLQVAGDLLDVPHRRRRHQRRQLALLARRRLRHLAQQMDVVALRRRRSAPWPAVDSGPATCRMLTARPRQAGLCSAASCGHHLRRPEAGRLPDAVGHGAEAEQVLAAVGLDQLPGRLRRRRSPLPDDLDLEVLAQQRRAAARRSGRAGRRPAGASAG